MALLVLGPWTQLPLPLSPCSRLSSFRWQALQHGRDLDEEELASVGEIVDCLVLPETPRCGHGEAENGGDDAGSRDLCRAGKYIVRWSSYHN
jgi:hypothetical protein